MSASVFLVEDDPQIAEHVRQTVEADPALAWGGVVSTVRQAEFLLGRETPDVLMVDLGLPDGSGVDVIRKARALGTVKSILVFTVFGEESNVIAAIEAGANGYILKGGAPGELGTAIRQVAEGATPISPAIAGYILRRLQAQTQNQPDDEQRLSGREVDVLRLVAQGFVNDEIAERLFISHHTVATHVRGIYRKLHVRSKGQAVGEAHRRGYI